MRKHKLCFLFHLPQDLDLLVPLIEQAKRDSHTVICLVYKKMISKSPRVVKYLQTTGTPWFAIDPYDNVLKASWHILKSTHVISAVETSVAPHKFGFYFTKIANFFGKSTITMQHGLENIGLTYSDASYPIESIFFASKKILIWSDSNQLLPNISPETKKKCIPFGCTKNFSPLILKKPAPFVVGVFENLHWSRYSDSYRDQFIHDFLKTAQETPDATFLIKPHHEGRWLTERAKKSFHFSENIIVIDPKNPNWEPYTGPSIIGISDIVITTPSTIALDAAVLQRPVCVAGYDLDVNRYSPLPLLRQQSDWQKSITAVRSNAKNFDEINKHYVKNNIYDLNCLQKFNSLL